MDDIVDAHTSEKRNFIYFLLIFAAFAFKRFPRQKMTEHIRRFYRARRLICAINVVDIIRNTP
jgi:hypothetical protein